MPLPNGYAVAIGKLSHFTRDKATPGTYGKYYHGHIHLTTSDGAKIECAVDVSTPEGMPVLYLERTLEPSALKPLAKLSDGVHKLASTSKSGALDYVRMKALKAKDPKVWTLAQADATLDLLESLLKKSKRLMVFGSPYTTGLGIHDVHMNQGDPAGTQWFKANGVWQDGGVVMKQGTKLLAFLTRFPSQSLKTDNKGNPK